MSSYIFQKAVLLLMHCWFCCHIYSVW